MSVKKLINKFTVKFCTPGSDGGCTYHDSFFTEEEANATKENILETRGDVISAKVMKIKDVPKRDFNYYKQFWK